MMKISNHEKCTLDLNLISLEIGIIYYIFPNFRILVMNLKLSMKVVTRLKTPLSLHGLQFSTLDTIVGSMVQFADYLLIVRGTI
jgi:hypothetical protein